MANNAPNRVPRWEKGDRLLAKDLNRLASTIPSRVFGGPGLRVQSTKNQLTIVQDRFLNIRPTKVAMQIVSVHDDYLTCKLVFADGSLGTENILVLKPWEIRRTPFEGQTVNGVAYTYNSDTERVANATDTYQITPDYWAGARILVERQNLAELLATGDYVDLIDCNQGCRTWALVSA